MQVAEQNRGLSSFCPSVLKTFGILKGPLIIVQAALVTLVFLTVSSIVLHYDKNWFNGTAFWSASGNTNGDKQAHGIYRPTSVPFETAKSGSTFASYNGCSSCKMTEFDANQCKDPARAMCLDIRLKSVREETYRRPLVYAPKLLITSGENVFIDSLLDDRVSIQSANLQAPGRQYTFRWNRPSGLTYAVKLSDVHVLPEYEDVSHESDNEMILRAEPGTYAHKLQASLLEVIQSFCRHPIPSWYHISMKMFRERNTVGRKKACDGQEQRKGHCSPGSGGKEYFYQRSLNEQCGRNRAAPLPEETNAFYCTRDTPLITELFGETVDESEVELEETLCVENRRKCMACIKQAERELRKTDAHMKRVYADMRNKQVTEDHGSNRDGAVHPEAESRCCSLACYNTPACLIFHSPVCHSDQTKFTNQSRADICLKGNTFKFSITPEFEFFNGTVQCHMRQVRSGIWMQIDQTVDFTNTVVGAKRWSYGISVPNRTVTSTLRITDDIRTKLSVSECIQMEVTHAELLTNVKFRGKQVWSPNGKTSDSDRMRETILVAKFQNKSKTYEYALYSLKPLEGGEYGSPSDYRPVIDRPVHGDSAFTTVQTFRPHVYNTATWRRVGCDLNISQFVRPRQSFRQGEGRPVDLFPLRDEIAPNTKASVSSRPEQHIDANKPHRFAVHDKSREWPRMTFRMLGNRSFIREAFCKSPAFGGHRLGITKREAVHPGNTFLKPAIEIQLSSVQSTQHERSLVLRIAGHVTGTPAYINVRIRYRKDGTLLAHHDFVIFPHSKSELTLQTSEKSETFELNYTFGDDTTEVKYEQFNSYEPLLDVIVTDCGFSRYFGVSLTSNQINSKFYTASFASKSTAKMTTGEELTDESLRWATYTPLFIICSCIGTSYLLVCLVYTLIRHFSFNYGKFTVHTSMISSGELNEPAVYHKIPLAPQSFRFNRGGQLYSARLGTEDSLYYGRNQDEAHQYNPTVVRLNSSNWRRLHLGEFSPWTIYATRCRTNVIPIRRLLLFAHLAFRVFYTFLFTFSVAVSLIFSLQPAPRSGAAEIVVQRPPVVASPGTGPWTASPYSRKNVLSGSRRMLGPLLRLQTESRWLEAFAEQELRRQLDYVDRMRVACQHAVGVEITDAVREMRQMVQDHLDKWHYGTKVDDAVVSIKQLGHGIKEAHLLISKYFAEQRQSLEKYRAQREQAFDYRVTGFYRSYAELLDNAYNSGWLRYVQRMLNTSMKADSSTMEHDNMGLGQDQSAFDGYEQTRWRGSLYSHYPMAQQNSGLDTKHVAMMTYMGFQQAEFVHFLPVQLKQELRRVFLSNQYRPQVLPPEIAKSDQTNHAERHSFESVDSGKPSSLASTVERTFISTNDMHHVEVSSEYSNIDFDLMSSEPGSDSTFHSGRWVNETQSPHLVGQMHALSLTEFRLVLLVLDFFIIIYRFYHTFLSLRDLWFGQKIYVDAASLLVMQHANRSDQSVLFRNTASVEGTSLTRLRTKNGEDHLGALGRANKNHLDRHSTSKLALLQELTKRNSRYVCTHAEAEHQADLMADLEVSELDPTSEKTARNKPLDTKGHLQPGNPVNHAHPVFPTYQCFPTHPLIVFRTEPLPLEAALALPPPPSFGPEQNVGCLMGVRVTCCRQSHYLSAVVGITVVLALLGLLILQEQRVFLQPTRVDSSVWHEPKTAPQPAKAANQLNTPRLSFQLSDAKQHYEGIIDKQSKRLNGDWLAWTKSKELSMRRRLLTYTARFKHDFSFFDRQIKAESEMINAAAIRFTKNIANERQSIPIANRSTDPPPTTRLNSEMLFRQQICHFLPVVPVPMPTDQQDMKSHARFTNDVDYKKMSVQNLLWTALISRAVEFEWSSLQQARQLSVTALLVATGMLGCIGIVDICGWMIQLRYLNPLYKTGHATDPNPMHRSETRSCRSNEIEVDREHIVLVSPQPPPLIPYPEDSPQSKDSPRPPASPTAQTHSSLLGFGTPCVDQKFTPTATTNSNVMTTTSATNPRTSSVQPQIPLTAFYVDPNLVLASNPTLHGLPLAASSPSVPIYITHTPGSPILIASTTGIDPNQTGTPTTITTITTQPT